MALLKPYVCVCPPTFASIVNMCEIHTCLHPNVCCAQQWLIYIIVQASMYECHRTDLTLHSMPTCGILNMNIQIWANKVMSQVRGQTIDVKRSQRKEKKHPLRTKLLTLLLHLTLTRLDRLRLLRSFSWGSVGRLVQTMWGVSYLSRSFGQLLKMKSMMKNLMPA